MDELLAVSVSDKQRPESGARIIRSEPDGSLSEQRIRMTGSASVDVQSVYRWYHDGFTVVINQMHRRSGAVGRLCRSLQGAFHHPVGANMYLTPARAQGFLPHADTHDVFILQIHGTKEWHVSSPTVQLPLPRSRVTRQTLQDAQSYMLEPGDTLYLPRGFQHAAVTGDSSSLHLTVGIEAFRWHDLFRDALELAAEEDESLRRALPAGYLNEQFDTVHVREMAHRVSVALANGTLIEKAKERIASRLAATDVATGLSQFRSLDALSKLTDQSLVGRPPGLLCLARLGPDRAKIEFASNYVTGPASLGPAFHFISQAVQFAVGDLPGELSREDRIDLTKRLVSEGLLEVLSV
ncbi:cupin domain-containing protein [Streptomyces sioyaensis]|uniref:cupin domain-containing protein n=1 Tax=Streptomyces sioyaensis TaxID=67364 RepID=UPI00371AEE99